MDSFYTLSPRPPHRLLATSGEWCLPTERATAQQSSTDFRQSNGSEPTCESIQLVFGMELLGDSVLEDPDRDAGSGGVHAASGPRYARRLQRGAADLEVLLLSWGERDCLSRIGRVEMRSVWQMLRPLRGESDVCLI